MILFGDPGDEQPRAWLDESLRSAKAKFEATPAQLRREPGDTKGNAEPFAQQPARDPLRPVAGTVSDRYDSLHFEAAAYARANAAEAEVERLRAENASLKEANKIDLREKAPLIFENTALSARVSELTRLLAEAEEAIRFSFMKLTTHRMIRVIPDETWPDGWDEWHKSPAVQRALQSGDGGEE